VEFVGQASLHARHYRVFEPCGKSVAQSRLVVPRQSCDQRVERTSDFVLRTTVLEAKQCRDEIVAVIVAIGELVFLVDEEISSPRQVAFQRRRRLVHESREIARHVPALRPVVQQLIDPIFANEPRSRSRTICGARTAICRRDRDEPLRFRAIAAGCRDRGGAETSRPGRLEPPSFVVFSCRNAGSGKVGDARCANEARMPERLAAVTLSTSVTAADATRRSGRVLVLRVDRTEGWRWSAVVRGGLVRG
jgi:hypothetical protein